MLDIHRLQIKDVLRNTHTFEEKVIEIESIISEYLE